MLLKGQNILEAPLLQKFWVMVGERGMKPVWGMRTAVATGMKPVWDVRTAVATKAGVSLGDSQGGYILLTLPYIFCMNGSNLTRVPGRKLLQDDAEAEKLSFRCVQCRGIYQGPLDTWVCSQMAGIQISNGLDSVSEHRAPSELLQPLPTEPSMVPRKPPAAPEFRLFANLVGMEKDLIVGFLCVTLAWSEMGTYSMFDECILSLVMSGE
ncbi:hypothetical protein STEG23_017038 [Scotinomys teguina]